MTPKDQNIALKKAIARLSKSGRKLADDHVLVVNQRDTLMFQNRVLADVIGTIAAERDKLKKFKEYVHGRLDMAGVPFDPEPEKNTEHGCRIEGRLNTVLRWCDPPDGTTLRGINA